MSETLSMVHMRQFMAIAANGQPSPHCENCIRARIDTEFGINGICWNSIIWGYGVCRVVGPPPSPPPPPNYNDMPNLHWADEQDWGDWETTPKNREETKEDD